MSNTTVRKEDSLLLGEQKFFDSMTTNLWSASLEGNQYVFLHWLLQVLENESLSPSLESTLQN